VYRSLSLPARAGHCTQLAPTWEALSEELAGEVAVAHVNVPANNRLAKRFSSTVQGFPTLLLFANRSMYAYEGERAQASLAAFARSGWKSARSLAVPPPPGMFDGVFGFIELHAKLLVGLCLAILFGVVAHAVVSARKTARRRAKLASSLRKTK